MKKKINLNDLKVKSFVTEVTNNTNIKGGAFTVNPVHSACGVFTCEMW